MITSFLFIVMTMQAGTKEPELPDRSPVDAILKTKGLVSVWDFVGGSFAAKGPNPYRLVSKAETPIAVRQEGPLSGSSIELTEGQYLSIARADCPALNLHGKAAQVTVLAWVKRKPKTIKPSECESIAGMWNETDKKRQYCLFLNLGIYDSRHQVCGHISAVGGPTPGQRWCMDASIGRQPVPFGEWTMVAFTYDGQQIRSYLNGKFDERPERNPYQYPEGIFDGGSDGADFTVGGVYRGGEMGNFFVGQLGGLALFDRALTEAEIQQFAGR